MPGPDDTMEFLQRYAADKGYTIPDNLDATKVSYLRQEAESLRHAERGLKALMELYLPSVEAEETVQQAPPLPHVRV